MPSIADNVITVLAARPPREVIEAIVGGIVIKVPTFQTFWAWSNKRLKDEAVDIPAALGRVKEYGEIALGVGNLLQYPLADPQRASSAGHNTCTGTNIAEIADLVFLKPQYRSPHVTNTTGLAA